MRLDWRWLVLSITLTAGIPAQNLPMPGKPSDNLAAAKVFDYASLAVTHNPNGNERRDVIPSGRLATGEAVHIHASMQPTGASPGRAHAIEHSEFILVTEGTLGGHLRRQDRTGGAGERDLHRLRHHAPGAQRRAGDCQVHRLRHRWQREIAKGHDP